MVLRQAIMKAADHSVEAHPDHYYAPLKEESRNCLKNLAAYHPQRERNPYKSNRYPLSRCAAVLVALFVGRWGDLYVLLSRRADDLKSYAGDTALPGGKRDPGDRSPEDTARREAFEEIGLPRDRRRIPLLCTVEPFLSTNNLIVFPVVVLVTDPAIKPVLNAPEVAALFSHPLRSLLSSSSPVPLSSSAEYHSFNDIEWGGPPDSRVRIHKFLTGREPDMKPLFGLTAAILLRVAIIGYGTHVVPDFDYEAPTQLPMRERIYNALTTVPALKEACRKEGVKPRKPRRPQHKEKAKL